MSEHGTPAIKPADDPAFKLPESLAALRIPLCGGGLAALLGGWGLGYFVVSSKFGMAAYLTAFMYCLTITLGCLFFVLIQHLARAGWSTVVRRIAELVMVMVVPLGVLFLPILLTLLIGNGTLYSWDQEGFREANHLPLEAWTEKSRWLNQGWFTVRAIIYFAIWSAPCDLLLPRQRRARRDRRESGHRSSAVLERAGRDGVLRRDLVRGVRLGYESGTDVVLDDVWRLHVRRLCAVGSLYDRGRCLRAAETGRDER